MVGDSSLWIVVGADFSRTVSGRYHCFTLGGNVIDVFLMGPVSGYVLMSEGLPTIYIMGDCKWEECTLATVEKYRPNYIVVNSGGAVFPEFSKTDGCIIPNEQEVMAMLDTLPPHIKLITVHMDAIDHCQTTRAILRNEARHHGTDMSRLIIPEDGESITLK